MTALNPGLPKRNAANDRRGPLRPSGLALSRARTTRGEVRRFMVALSLTLILLSLGLAVFTRLPIVGVAAGLVLALAGSQVACWMVLRHWRAQGRLTPNVVVVGATEEAKAFIRAALERRDIAVLGVFDDRARGVREVEGVPMLGDLAALRQHRLIPFIDRIVIAVPQAAQARIGALIGQLSDVPNEINLILKDQGAAVAGQIAGAPLARLSGAHADLRRAAIKRALDLVVGSLALVAASPILAMIALAVRLDSPGPIFFRQRRHGFNHEEIVVWKFRTMRHETADATAARQVSVDDDRVTRVGAILRRASLDELPQLLNVLAGQMSLVGPRPHAIGMMTGGVESASLVAGYAHRHRMKPGITGWAAVNGSRGPVDTPESVRLRVELDVAYIERQSFWLDLWILAITLPCLLGDRSAVR
ncbi:MAG: hfsE [Caulobacteraceae bacterium]|nr:hfsE [Caulobacteraceae bacterium]